MSRPGIFFDFIVSTNPHTNICSSYNNTNYHNFNMTSYDGVNCVLVISGMHQSNQPKCGIYVDNWFIGGSVTDYSSSHNN